MSHYMNASVTWALIGFLGGVVVSSSVRGLRDTIDSWREHGWLRSAGGFVLLAAIGWTFWSAHLVNSCQFTYNQQFSAGLAARSAAQSAQNAAADQEERAQGALIDALLATNDPGRRDAAARDYQRQLVEVRAKRTAAQAKRDAIPVPPPPPCSAT